MDLIADMLLVAGALGAGVYCVVLSRRLSRFNDLQGGVGGAVAALSSQVDEMTRALERSRRAAGEQASSLERSTRKATEVSRRLELLVASMHDLPAAPTRPATAEAPAAAPPAAPAEPAAERPEAGPPKAAPAAPAETEAGAAADRTAPGRAEPPLVAPVPAEAEAVGPAPDAPEAGPLAAWDDWDPLEIAAPPAARRDGDAAGTQGRADRTPAPGPTATGRAEPAEGTAAAPALRAVPPMPIFTAARPVARAEPPAPRARAAQ